MDKLRYPETALAASAILSACERGDFGRFGVHLDVAGDSKDSGEQERRELIEEIVSRIDGENWRTFEGLLGHLALTSMNLGSKSIH